jgi:hypothetical protein
MLAKGSTVNVANVEGRKEGQKYWNSRYECILRRSSWSADTVVAGLRVLVK